MATVTSETPKGRPRVKTPETEGKIIGVRFESEVLKEMDKTVKRKRISSRNWFVNRACERFAKELKNGSVFM